MSKVDELLSAMREIRTGTQEALAGITEQDMEKEISVRQGTSYVRAQFYSMITHEAEHTTHLIKTLGSLGLIPSEAHLILRRLQESRGHLEALLVGLSDADLDRVPSEGEWTVRQVVQHILDAEESIRGRIGNAVKE